MPSTSRWSRWSDLFGLGSVPGSEDEARAFLRRRVRLYFQLLFGIFSVIYVVVILMVASIGQWAILRQPERLLHVGLCLFLGAAWIYAGRRKTTRRELSTVDAVGTLALGLAIGVFASYLPPAGLLMDMALVLYLNQALLVRAIIVPSTATRTLALGLLASAPLIVAYEAAARHAGHMPGMLPGHVQILEAVFCLLLGCALTGLTSRVIYGLRRRVAEFARLGQYTLGEKLGEGGMGVVHRATHAMLRRPAALKLLPPDRAGARAIARFEREVNLTATLTHPNIIAVYDFGRTPDGVFYYVMEYLDGLDLEALVRADGPQPPGRVIHILKQVAGALAEAHRAGLIHRDIKPANIILCQRGSSSDFAKVVDFGLVRDLGDATRLDQSTAHALEGTPLYLSPEGITSPADVDGRSDCYALGAVGYFLLTGAPVFNGETLIGVYAKHLNEKPVPPSEKIPGLSPALEALILATLEKSPADRPQSADALLERLEAIDDVPPWTAAEARAWWSTRGTAARSGTTAPTPSLQQLAVDLTLRG